MALEDLTNPGSESELSESSVLFFQEHIRASYPFVAEAAQSVIQIVCLKEGKFAGTGSGIALASGHILTAEHVLADADELILRTVIDTRKPWERITRGKTPADSHLDAALLPLPETFKGKVRLLPTPESSFHEGEPGFLIGFPMIKPSISWLSYQRSPTIHAGLLIPTSLVDNKICMQISDGTAGDTPEAVHGASGGAIVNESGELIGLTVSVGYSGSYFVFGTPIEAIQSSFSI